MTSRFHIVKIDTGPHKRGRWTCLDRTTSDQEPTAGVGGTLAAAAVSSGTNSSRSSSHGAGGVEALSSPLAVNDLPSVDTHDGATDSPLAREFLSTPAPQQVIGRKVLVVDASLANAGAPPTTNRPPPVPDGHQAIPPVKPAPPVIGTNPSSAFVRVTSSSRDDAANGNLPTMRRGCSSAMPAATAASPSPAVLEMLEAAAAVDHGAAAASVVAAAAAQVVAMCLQGEDGNSDVEITGAATSILLDSIITPSTPTTNETGAPSTTVAEPAAAPLDGTLAIDNKIEQAMDLVKTHLRYAVREEVEVLKQRIQDLEKYVDNLEKENKVLREFAPAEILTQMRLVPPSLVPTSDQPTLSPIIITTTSQTGADVLTTAQQQVTSNVASGAPLNTNATTSVMNSSGDYVTTNGSETVGGAAVVASPTQQSRH